MTRNEAVKYAYERMEQTGLKEWHIRLTTDMNGDS